MEEREMVFLAFFLEDNWLSRAVGSQFTDTKYCSWKFLNIVLDVYNYFLINGLHRSCYW